MTIPTFPVFPGLSWPVNRSGPIFDTIVQESFGGQQTAYAKRITPKWTWELMFEFLRSDSVNLEMQTLAGFHASVFGRAQIFQYQDSVDKAASATPFGVGDGVTTAFQLTRPMGGFAEPVYAPVGALVIDVGGTPTVAYTTTLYGMINFTTAPALGAPLTWTGSYNWLCRFDADKIDFSNFMFNLWEVKKISFTSIIV